jgi:transcription initiation factor TFIIIB Brf1 subunit/transcription initiation factor TFIIB
MAEPQQQTAADSLTGTAPDDPYGLLGTCTQSVTGADLQATLRLACFQHAAVGTTALSSEPEAEEAAEATGDPSVGAEPASNPAPPWEMCPECLCQMQVQGLEFVCPICCRVSEGPLEMEVSDREGVRYCSSMVRPAPRLRIVGPDSAYYQRDLDRNTTVDYSETQRRHVMQELMAYNTAYREQGGNPFPINVLEATADAYGQVQRVCVKRSQMKQTILAALLYHMCIKHNFTRDRHEVADFAQLRSHGIARGDDFLRSLQADQKIDIDVNRDRLTPYIVTTFARMKLGSKYASDLLGVSATFSRGGRADPIEALQAAVRDIVGIAVDKNIGTQSVLRSKVIATTYEVLRRAGAKTTLDDIVSRCTIRKNTITRFTTKLFEYHTHFQAAYAQHNLDDSRSGHDAPVQSHAQALDPPLSQHGKTGQGTAHAQ